MEPVHGHAFECCADAAGIRHEPEGVSDLEAHNQMLITRINNDGRIYLTQTKLDGQLLIRFQAGSWDMTEADADVAYAVIVELAAAL